MKNKHSRPATVAHLGRFLLLGLLLRPRGLGRRRRWLRRELAGESGDPARDGLFVAVKELFSCDSDFEAELFVEVIDGVLAHRQVVQPHPSDLHAFRDLSSSQNESERREQRCEATVRIQTRERQDVVSLVL